jgi:putative endonuclease
MQTRRKGRIGEEAAARYLAEKGFAVLEKNYFTKGGEIDIIFKDADTVVFAEVKYRTGNKFGTPAEAVTPLKIRRISASAVAWLSENSLADVKCRFDIIEVMGAYKSINHIKNAFEAIL